VAEVPHISAVELAQRLENGDAIDVIDVREDWERDISKVAFAKAIPMNEIPQRTAEIPKDTPVVVMCRSGGRSSQVATFLESEGYTNVLNLEGGILRWALDVDPSLPKSY